jgi:hypothetical protein
MPLREVANEYPPRLARTASNVNVLDLDLPWVESFRHLGEDAVRIAGSRNRHALRPLQLERRPNRPPLQHASWQA